MQIFKIRKIKNETSFKLSPNTDMLACIAAFSFFFSFTNYAYRSKKRTPWNPHSWTQKIFTRIYVNFKLPFCKIILPIKLFVGYFPHIPVIRKIVPKNKKFNALDPFHRNANPAIRTARKCTRILHKVHSFLPRLEYQGHAHRPKKKRKKSERNSRHVIVEARKLSATNTVQSM